MLIVLHGKASNDAGVRLAVEAVQREGAGALRVDVRPTYSAGDATAIVRAELAAAGAGARPPVSVVVAGGGDGTLCEVMAALLEHRDENKKKNKWSAPGGKAKGEGDEEGQGDPSVASLLMGTANDLGSACGVSADPAEALRLAADPSRAKPVDVAFCNGRPFANVATAGPISAVTSAGMSDALKRVLGPLSVPLAGVATLLSPSGRHALQPQPVTLVFPTARDVPEPPLPPGLRAGTGGGAAAAGRGGGGGGRGTSAVADAAAAAVAAAAGAAGGGGGVASSPLTEKEQQQQQDEHNKEAGVVVMRPPQGAAGAAVAGGKVMAVRGALVALAVGQARQMGRFINITPAALLDDGLLDVTALFAPSIGGAAADLARDAVAAVAEAATAVAAGGAGAGEGAGGGEEGPGAAAVTAPLPLAGLCTLRVPWLHVYLEDGGAGVAGTARGSLGGASNDATAEGAADAAAAAPPAAAAAAAAVGPPPHPPPLLAANLDGEPIVLARALRFHLLPRAVRMHLPDDRLLIAGVADATVAAEGGGVGGASGGMSTATATAGANKARREELEAAARSVSVDFAGAAEHGGRSRAAARLSRRLSAPLVLLRGGGGRRREPPSRAAMLRALLRAQQPPGRLARALPVILARVAALARALTLVLLGAALAVLALGRV